MEKARVKQEQKDIKEREKEIQERQKLANFAIAQFGHLDACFAAEMSKKTFPHVPRMVRDPCESYKKELEDFMKDANGIIRTGGVMDAKSLGTQADMKTFAGKAKKALVLLVAVNSSLEKTGGI